MASITFQYNDSNGDPQTKVATINLGIANQIAANIGYQTTVPDPVRVAAFQAQQAVVAGLETTDPTYIAELETLRILKTEMDNVANFISNPLGMEDAVYQAIKNKLLELLRDNSNITSAATTAENNERQSQDTTNETNLGL